MGGRSFRSSLSSEVCTSEVARVSQRRLNWPTRFLRWIRNTSAGGAIEYAAQLFGGLLHPELLQSGATEEEQRCPLPGDELVAQPMWEATRAVSIEAASADIWPWVAQMGYGRGGWYGWNPLEREDTGVSRLLANMATPKPGDVWLDGPGCDKTKGAWTVVAADPPSTLVLHSLRDPITGAELEAASGPRLFIDTVWTFVLEPVGPRTTRLLARTRIRMRPRWALLPLRWMGGGDTVMQRRLLDGIRYRATTLKDGSPQDLSPLQERSGL